jgi:hypothetical protein
LHDKVAALTGIILMDYDRSDIATTYDQARALTPARPNFSQVAAGVSRRWPEVTVKGAILERCSAASK